MLPTLRQSFCPFEQFDESQRHRTVQKCCPKLDIKKLQTLQAHSARHHVSPFKHCWKLCSNGTLMLCMYGCVYKHRGYSREVVGHHGANCMWPLKQRRDSMPALPAHDIIYSHCERVSHSHVIRATPSVFADTQVSRIILHAPHWWPCWSP